MIRNRRRTATAILGVVLAVTFIAGTFIAIDSSTRATLEGLLAGYPSDIAFSARSFLGNATQMREAVEAVPGVVRVATSLSASFNEIEPSGRPNATVSAGILGVEPGHLPRNLESITVTQGSLGLARGTVALTEGLATTLKVAVGQTVAFRSSAYYYPYNATISRLNVTVAALFRGVSADSGPYGPGPFFGTAIALVHIRDIEWYNQQLNISYGNAIVGEVRVDRERLLDPYDLESSRRNMARLDRQINDALAPFAGSVTIDYVANALTNFASVITFQRVFYLALSTPVILLGLYLGAIGVDLGHADRRRELAVLKTRGAGRRQILGLLLVEALLGGFLAAVVGLVAGVGLSRLLLNFVSPFGPSTAPRYDVIVFSTSTVVTVIILAVIFMGVTSFRSARRTASLPIVETLRHYAPGETKIQYRPTIDIILVVLAVGTYGMVLYARSNQADFLTFLVGIIFFILLPFAPFFLIVGSTRLLTRSTGRVYEWTARAAKPFAKNLYYVIAKNLQRNPRRSANVAIIIALGIAFGMFILITFSSQLAYQERRVRASIGADVAVDSPPSDRTFGTNLSRLPGVVGTTRVQTLRATAQYAYPGVYALDPATFFTVTSPESWYFRDGGADAARQVLATPGHVLVTESYLRESYLAVGDRLRLEGFVFNGTGGSRQVIVNTTIGGTVRGLPGADTYGFGMPRSIFGSFDTFAALVSTSPYYGEEHYLADLAAGADWRGVKDAIFALGATRVQVVEEQLLALRANPVFQAFFGFMQLEMAFMVVILTAGLGLILYAATLERDVELAAIRARGASGWQTAGLLIGEAASIMLIGLLVGAGIGTLSAYLGTSIVSTGPGGGTETLIPLAFTIPLEALLLVALAPVAILVTSFLVSVRVARMDIGRVLKLRGG